VSFLSPSVLWWLFATPIPFIIHLISTRRTQKVEFSTIRFIKALEHDAIRKLKLRQWLLLFLRTIAILLLILTFARPVKVGYFPAWAAGDKTTKMIFLLDNSASMSALSNSHTLLERAKRTLLEILEGVEGKLLIDIYQTTPFQRRFSGEFISMDQVEGVLSLVRETYGTDNISDTIEDILAQARLESRGSAEVANQEFFIFSDFPSSIPRDWRPGSTYSDESVQDWRYYLFPQPEIENNLTVTSVKVLSQLRLLDHLISVASSVKNQTEEPRNNIPVQLYFDDDRVSQVVSDFSSLQLKNFVFQAFPNHPGLVRGVVDIPEDNFELDNQTFFQFFIPPKITCKIMGSSQNQLSLLTLALSSINQDSLFIIFDEIPSYSPSTLSLDETDVLILVDPGSLNPSLLNEISKYTGRGGSIFVFLGEQVANDADPSFLESLFLPISQGMISSTEEGFYPIVEIQNNHPLFLDFPTGDLSEEMPHIFTYVQSRVRDQSNTILTLSNGDPLLIENSSSLFKVLAFTTMPDLLWTDLPMRGIFVPLLHRILVYLATDEGQAHAVEVGTNVTIPLRREFITGEIEMVSPSGRKTILVPDYRRELVTIENVDEVGVYLLFSNGQEVTSFVTNISSTENPAERLKMEELFDIFPNNRTRFVEWSEDAVTSVIEARRGTELWLLFLITTLLVLMIETWVGRAREERTKS